MTVTLAIPTVTYAVKAKKILQRVGIPSKLIKTVSENGGCVYAVEIDADKLYSAVYELKGADIPYSSVDL